MQERGVNTKRRRGSARALDIARTRAIGRPRLREGLRNGIWEGWNPARRAGVEAASRTVIFDERLVKCVRVRNFPEENSGHSNQHRSSRISEKTVCLHCPRPRLHPRASKHPGFRVESVREASGHSFCAIQETSACFLFFNGWMHSRMKS